MKYSEVKEFIKEWGRDVLEQILNGESDFKEGKYRFISGDVIDGVLVDELQGDPYLLGCFNADVIAEATGWPVELIIAAQKGEAYSEIGDAMSLENVKELAKLYVGYDGYGHYFAQYDGREYEFTVDGARWYAFRVY